MSLPGLRRLLALPSGLRTLAFKQACVNTSALRSVSTTAQHHLESSPPPSNTTAQPPPTDTTPPPPPTQSSVNNDEVAHFNALASSWWDPHGSSRLLHLMNPLRHDFMRKCKTTEEIGSSTTDKLHYLDIGCGGGIFAESAARRAHTASVTAIDPTPEVIAVARRHQRLDPLLLQPGRLTYKQIPLEDLPKPATLEEGYDIITVFEVLEHIQRPSAFLASCLPYLKPGGWLIGSTIARTNVSWLTTKLVAEDLLRIVPRGTHDWNQYIQPNELFQWAKIQKELDVKADGTGWMKMGVVYVPGFGWREVKGSEEWGNYFFGVRRKEVSGVRETQEEGP